MRANEDIRQAIANNGLLLWQVAEAYGLTDSNFSRLLRRPLPADKKERVIEAIAKAKQMNEED